MPGAGLPGNVDLASVRVVQVGGDFGGGSPGAPVPDPGVGVVVQVLRAHETDLVAGRLRGEFDDGVLRVSRFGNIVQILLCAPGSTNEGLVPDVSGGVGAEQPVGEHGLAAQLLVGDVERDVLVGGVGAPHLSDVVGDGAGRGAHIGVAVDWEGT